MTPERFREDLEDEPDDEREDERRAARHDWPLPRTSGGLPVEPADFMPWMR